LAGRDRQEQRQKERDRQHLLNLMHVDGEDSMEGFDVKLHAADEG
jgi:hypothetical protein